MVASLSFGQLAGLMGGSAGLGFAGNLISSGINSARAWKYAHEAMHYQDKLNRRFTRDQYGLMREGLTKADYNPLLALNGMSASTPSSAVGIGQSDSDNGAQAVTSALDSVRLANETKVANATADKVEAETDEIRNRINSSPRKLISDLITKGESSQYNGAIKALSAIKNKYGLSWLQPRNFLNKYIPKIPKVFNTAYSAISNNNQVYKLKAVYNHNINDKSPHSIGVWNSNRRYKGEIISGNPHHVTKYKVKSKPPTTYPSEM